MVMAVSNRVKRNIYFVLTLLGCSIIVARIADPIMEGDIDSKGWFDIIGACILTFFAYDSFSIYKKRVRKGIKFGS